jgi:hypothetical protein
MPACLEANRRYQADYRDGQRGTHGARLGPYKITTARPDSRR